MTASGQAATIDFLSDPATFGVATVERVETHASIVFLAGPRAYKLKRAVQYDYLDFSTVERRQAMCTAELRLNRRAAPSIYRRVLAVTRESHGRLALEGDGPAVDWLIEMVRFDQHLLFDRLAAAGRLEIEVMAALAEAVSRFHGGAVRRSDRGGFPGICWVIDGNAHSFSAEARGSLDPHLAARVTDEARRAAGQHRERLERRRREGRVRECHGDLHLRNIVLLDGRPTLFDAVEFNDDISCIDVLYDTAFLLMDLWQRGLCRHANELWNRGLGFDDDLDGLTLLPLFLSCRAGVRAKTSATAARLAGDDRARVGLESAASRYLRFAGDLLRPPAPRLLAIGGPSGTGKSTIARALAPAVGAAPGAVVLRSDEQRKRLLGVGPLERLGAAGYTPAISEQVYALLAERARAVIHAGHSAIVDAACIEPGQRDALARVADAIGVPFEGLWLEAPQAALEARVTARRDDPSDADAEVVGAQLARDPGRIDWRRLDTSGSVAVVTAAAAAALDVEVP